MSGQLIVGGDFVTHQAPVVRSHYREQIRSIAPQELLGRDRELSELEAFCVGTGTASYQWWQAPAWAGKSALMAWFVLHPPPGVPIVAFFITARYAGQSDRLAFADVVLEQLADLLGQPMPAFLTDATRDAHLIGMLVAAAQLCQQRGQRLILVVDGLDEDRGVTVGPDAHSIAALLPADPPAGMRVIVAGRPSPPVPNDVPDDHPLRDARIVRVLRPSPHAGLVRADAQRELARLLHGSTFEQDLLGLVTGAGGGLCRADLAELTGLSPWQIEEQLGAVSGRTFRLHRGHWRTDARVLLLGHEELQQEAVDRLGVARLADYRERLHAWADRYQARRWPAETPEYLLHGYVRLLRALGDTGRLVALAINPARHQRLFEVSGSDAAALAEIALAQDAVARSPEPNLSLVVKLARHREVVEQRTYGLPAELPAAWARIGETARAEAMAAAVTFADTRAEALERLVGALAWRGEIEQAERIAAGIALPHRRRDALQAVADGWTAVGRPVDAARLASEIGSLNYATGCIDDDPERTSARILKEKLARIMQVIDDTDHITELARTSANECETYLRCMVHTLARQGDHENAAQLEAIIDAELLPSNPFDDLHFGSRPHNLASLLGDTNNRFDVLCDLIALLNEANERDRARIAIDAAEALTTKLGRMLENLAARQLAWLAADAGEITRARAIIRGPYLGYGLELDAFCILAATRHGDTETRESLITRCEAMPFDAVSPADAAKIYAVVADAVAQSGEPERARVLAVRAEEAARRPARTSDDLFWVTGTARALALIGHPAARTVLRRARKRLDGPIGNAGKGLFSRLLVEAATWAGDHDWAYDLWRTSGRYGHHHTTPLVKALTDAGKFDFAVTVAEQLDWDSDTEAWTVILDAAVRSSDLDRAESLAARWQRGVPGGGTALTRALLAAGHLDRAEAIARRHEPIRMTGSLVIVAEALAAVGATARAHDVAGLVIDVTPPEDQQFSCLPDLIRASAVTGNTAAGTLADVAIAYLREADIDTGYEGGWGVLPWRAPLAVALATIGDPDRAEAVAEGVGAYADTLTWTALITTPTPSYRQRRERWHSAAHTNADSLVDEFDFPPDFSIRAEPEWIAAAKGVAVALAQNGDHERADSLADAVKYGSKRHQITTALATVAAASGDLERAERLISKLAGTDAEPAISFDVAEAAIRRARTAPPVEARRLVAWAWRLGTWPILFDGLAHVDRAVVAELAADLGL